MNHRAVSYRDILTGNPLLRILRPCFNGDAVITHIDIAVADADIHTGLWVNAVCIRRIRRIIDRQIINRNVMATDRIHSPAWEFTSVRSLSVTLRQLSKLISFGRGYSSESGEFRCLSHQGAPLPSSLPAPVTDTFSRFIPKIHEAWTFCFTPSQRELTTG